MVTQNNMCVYEVKRAIWVLQCICLHWHNNNINMRASGVSGSPSYKRIMITYQWLPRLSGLCSTQSAVFRSLQPFWFSTWKSIQGVTLYIFCRKKTSQNFFWSASIWVSKLNIRKSGLNIFLSMTKFFAFESYPKEEREREKDIKR